MTLRVKSKFWLEDENGRPLFGKGKERILRKIHELGSIRAAATDLGISYRAVWGKNPDRRGATGNKTDPGQPGRRAESRGSPDPRGPGFTGMFR